ncbi:MAG TPA: hypothetical protein VM165_13980, partial [Planctomycetaceae bacterium]|nr:hypothetical protein [Planctomycetaceae bacterium]
AGSAAMRTAWGAPDLGGLWNSYTLTPLQRPVRFGTRTTFTDKEAADLTRQLAPIGDQPRSGDDEHDVAGAYNHSVFIEQGTTFTENRTSLIIDPPDGRIPPYTAEAQKRIAAMRGYLDALLQGTSGGKPGPVSPRRAEPPPFYNVDRMNRGDGPEDRSTPERCFGVPLPLIGGGFGAGGVVQLVQGPDSLTIFYDIGQGSAYPRVIPITSTPHLPATIRQRLGDARGHWEGDTLVADTTNFTQKMEYNGSRENLHLVERFTRKNPTTLTYRVTVEDPTTWTRPWTAEMNWTKDPDKDNRVFEQTCHEGNYGLLGMLMNTRASEKAFAEGKGPDPATMDIATGGEFPLGLR